MHTAKTAGFTQLSEMLVVALIFGFIAYWTIRLGWPAALEWWTHLRGESQMDLRRSEFNLYLRGITSVVEFVCLILVAGAAAAGIASERAQVTWDSLLATPLSGQEVLRGKVLGAAWKARWGVALLLALWSTGLLAGSLHPLGFCATVALLFTSTWFVASLGTYASLVSRDVAHATSRTVMTVVFLTGTFFFCYFRSPWPPVFMGAPSVPFVNWLCLVTYQDVAEAAGARTFSQLDTIGISTRDAAVSVVSAYAIAVVGYAAAAAWCNRAALGRFDQIAGRPAQARASAHSDSEAIARTGLPPTI